MEVVNQSSDETQENYQDEEPGEMIELKLQNVVSTVNFQTNLDLEKINSAAKNAEYNPRRFQAVIMRIRDPKTTALIFGSGKMIVTGAKSIEESNVAARKYTQIIQKVGFPVKFLDFKVQNITATCDVGFPIRLEGFFYAHAQNATYEPELFPGLVYRMVEPKVVLLIFVSGKVVITGAKTSEALAAALEEIYDKLFEFRKKSVVIAPTKS